MNQERIGKVLKKTEADALLLCDPSAIFYLTGKTFSPGERFLGLLLNKEDRPKLFLNALFPYEPDEGLDVIVYSDTDVYTELLRPHLNPDWVLGVDKDLPARFLLPILKQKLVRDCVDGSLPVDRTRAIKDEEELRRMRRSSQINDEAMGIFKTLIKEGVTEKEVASQIPEIYKSLGALSNSFEPIVAFGRNAADPHHMPDDTLLKEGDAVLFDVGCIYEDYCSDMTRTFFYKKGPTPEQKKIYELVKKANEDAEAYVKAGVRLCDIDSVARNVIEKGGYGPYFTHRLGHFIGTQVHEYGDVSQSFKVPAEAGNTFSIEPGIYYPEILGCRIEDLVIVTEDGCEVLNHYPHDIEIIG